MNHGDQFTIFNFFFFIYRQLPVKVMNNADTPKVSGLTTHLVEVGAWLGLAYSVEVVNVDQLEVVVEARVGYEVLVCSIHVRQVAQLFVSPVVQVADAAGCKQTEWLIQLITNSLNLCGIYKM